MNKKSKKKYCGAGKSAFLIPQFIFTASCRKHDQYFLEGGGIVEFVKANTFFYAYMLEDISKGGYGFIRKMFYFKMATLYFIMVSIFGGIFFNWKINKINSQDK
jgi:hypothetical protein